VHHLTNNISASLNQKYQRTLSHPYVALAPLSWNPGDALWHLDGGTEISFPIFPGLIASKRSCHFLQITLHPEFKICNFLANYLCAVTIHLLQQLGIAKWQRGAGPTPWVINSLRVGNTKFLVYVSNTEWTLAFFKLFPCTSCNRGIAPLIPKLDIRWRWLFKFTLRPP
jgi:hypothetical protein